MLPGKQHQSNLSLCYEEWRKRLLPEITAKYADWKDIAKPEDEMVDINVFNDISASKVTVRLHQLFNWKDREKVRVFVQYGTINDKSVLGGILGLTWGLITLHFAL